MEKPRSSLDLLHNELMGPRSRGVDIVMPVYEGVIEECSIKDQLLSIKVKMHEQVEDSQY